MKQTPALAALGCGGTLILLGSFVSGFYLGNSQARGQPVDETLPRLLKYGPTIIGGLYGAITCSATLAVPENLEEIANTCPPNMSREDAEGCAKGCAPIMGGIMGTALIGGATYLGYAIGHAMGR